MMPNSQDAQQAILQQVVAVARSEAVAMGISPDSIGAQGIQTAETSPPKPHMRAWIVLIQAHDETMRIRVTQDREHHLRKKILRWEIQPAVDEYFSNQDATGSYYGAPRSTDLLLGGERIGWAELVGRTPGKRPFAVYHLYDKGLRSLYKRRIAGNYVLEEQKFTRLAAEQKVLWEKERHDAEEEDHGHE